MNGLYDDSSMFFTGGNNLEQLFPSSSQEEISHLKKRMSDLEEKVEELRGVVKVLVKRDLGEPPSPPPSPPFKRFKLVPSPKKKEKENIFNTIPGSPCDFGNGNEMWSTHGYSGGFEFQKPAPTVDT